MINRGLLTAGAVLVVANLFVLGGVSRNRAGNPDAVVRLSDRELETWGSTNKGAEAILNLRLRWNMAPGPDAGATWFDRARLQALGVTRLPEPNDSAAAEHWTRDTRMGYAVLELAGPAWQRWAASQADSGEGDGRLPMPAPESKGPDRTVRVAGSSRLTAVDIGNDPRALRQRYPERSQYLILPITYQAVVMPAVRDSLGTVTEPARIEGRITQLLPGTVHVPRPLRDSLLGLGAARTDSTRHFEVTYKVGKNWEGWVE